MLLQRPAAAFAALNAFGSAAEKRALSASELRAMRTEADVFRAVVECYADRTAGVDELVAECLSRPDSVTPWVVAAAANVASFLEIYRFDFDAVRRWQHWADPYHQRSSGPFSLCTGTASLGIAANEELDVAEAERCFREALRVAKRSGGTQSHATRLACALLGQLLYERGEVDEADRLLDESYQLGSEGGVVEFMIARYVIGARIKAVRGDRAAAAERLDDGARVAATLGLPRLRAHVDNERMRLDLPVAAPPGRLEHEDALPDGGLGEITAQLRDETEICGLLADQPGLACERAQAWVHRLQPQAAPARAAAGQPAAGGRPERGGPNRRREADTGTHRRPMRRTRDDPLPARRRATGCRAAGRAPRRPAQRSLEADMAGDTAGLPRQHREPGPEHQLRRRR